MTDKPVISIIIPCFNQGQFLNDCIGSVRVQQFSKVEIIVVNDGSDEPRTLDAVRSIGGDVTVVNTSNVGLAAARNLGIANSSGKYILPLDADDMLTGNYLQAAVDLMERDTGISVVYGRAEYFGEREGEWELPEFSKQAMLFSNCVYASALFRRMDFDKTDGYDPGMKNGWEDWEFWLSLIEQGAKFVKLDEIVFRYRIRQDSMIRKLTEEQQAYLRRRIYCRHSNLYTTLFSDPMSLYYDLDYYRGEHDRLLGNKAIRGVNYLSKKLNR